MLTSFHLKNFKSFKHDAILPLGSLTVLMGANAAGKSNALEGLRLLSWLAQGNKLSTIQHMVNRTDKVVRGRVPDLFYKGENRFTLGCSVGKLTLHMEIELRGDDLHIIAESLATDQSLYEITQPSIRNSTEVSITYNTLSEENESPRIPVNDQMAVFAQLDSPASFHAKHIQAQQFIPLLCKFLQGAIYSILFLDPVPSKMRDYSFLADKQLGDDGSNLSSVLFRLWYDGYDNEQDAELNHAIEQLTNIQHQVIVEKNLAVEQPDTLPVIPNREEILSFIQSLPEQDIQGLSFLKGPRGDVMVQLVESFGGVQREYEAALLSDGTLRVLAIAAAMLSAPEGSMVVIEEIDNGVHPSRARHLLERIQTVAERRKLHVLISTHNPAMLDALPDKAVPDVVFCYRDPIEGDSRLLRLGNLPDAPELLLQNTLGHLVTTGTLDRFVKNRPEPEDRKQKARSWLAALRATEQGNAP